MSEKTETDVRSNGRGADRLALVGATPLYACQVDQRFSFCLFVPLSLDRRDGQRYPLVVTVHGTGRRALAYRDAFTDFAETHGCVILAPLFPGGIVAPWEMGSYKLLKDGDLRYDHVLLAMIDQVATVLPIETSRFLLHGFSGGGQFAHRFFYVHPDRLLGVSIGAPGSVTLLKGGRDWWVGMRNFASVFENQPNDAAMQRVAVQMVIGGADNEPIEITPNERRWMPGANEAGRTRLERLGSLSSSFARNGIPVQYDIVPGVGHDGFKLLGPVQAFFAGLLRERSGRTHRQ